MKALQSLDAKRMLRECDGAHGRGVVLANAIAKSMNEKEFQFYCTSCGKLIAGSVMKSVRVK